MIGLGCVTGRFQPVHAQHLELFGIALAECEHLVVAVTNPDRAAHHREHTSAHRHTAAANPFTYYERVRLLEVALTHAGLAGRTTIVPFDLTRPEAWPSYVPLAARQFVRAFSDWERQKAQWFAQAGYVVEVLEGDPADRLSASDIRGAMRAGGSEWHAMVPAATTPLLDELLARRPMADRA